MILPPNNHYSKGYYTCNGKVFFSKVEALFEATQTKQEVKWHFNEDVFGLYDWSIEPEESIEELYIQRARQLREKYDYLVIVYSGGVDSSTALKSFIKGNAYPDEIHTWAEPSARHDHSYKQLQNLEIEKAALPLIKELQKHTQIKHRHTDRTQYTSQAFHEDWIFEADMDLSISTTLENYIYEQDDYKKIAEKGKKVGLVYGVDKPRVVYEDGGFWFKFLDSAIGDNPVRYRKENLWWENHEFFYWSPDATRMLCKQGHLIMNYLKGNPNLINTDLRFKMPDMIYPWWDKNTFSVGKTPTSVICFKDDWFFDTPFHDEEAVKNWKIGLERIQQNTDPSYLNKGSVVNGFVGLWSQKKYYLGKGEDK